MSIHDAVAQLAQADHDAKIENASCRNIAGGYRCGITACNGLNDGDEPDGWWVGYSPRNGMNASVEGPWADWVELAHQILAEDARRQADTSSEQQP